MSANQFDALRLALPGIAKCQPLSQEDVDTMAMKAELADLLARLQLSKRRAALSFGVDESTVRGWLNPLALNRRPSDAAMDRARDLVEAGALRALAAKLETGS